MSIVAFLRQRAVDVIVAGTYVLPNWYDPSGKLREFACRTSRVSPFRMMIDVPVAAKIGDQISSYFADFGELNGTVTDAATGGLLVELSMDATRRARMSEQLTWLERKQKDPSVKDLRGSARIIPAVPHSTVTLADGSIHRCFVIDVSATGAAVSAELQPAIGTPLAIGACVGRVARNLPHGFAVHFLEKHKRHELERLICRRGPKYLGEADNNQPAVHVATPAKEKGLIGYIDI